MRKIIIPLLFVLIVPFAFTSAQRIPLETVCSTTFNGCGWGEISTSHTISVGDIEGLCAGLTNLSVYASLDKLTQNPGLPQDYYWGLIVYKNGVRVYWDLVQPSSYVQIKLMNINVAVNDNITLKVYLTQYAYAESEGTEGDNSTSSVCGRADMFLMAGYF